MFEGQSQADIEAMMKANSEFRQLYFRHRELDKQVLDAELGVLPVDADFIGWMAREAAAMPAAVWRALCDMLEAIDLRRAAGEIAAPVLLLAGEKDVLFGASHRVALRAALPRAEAETLAK